MKNTFPMAFCMLSLFAFLGGCSGFETLEVVYSSPENHALGVAEDAPVEIAFNSDVERDSLEKGFVLAGSSSRIEGDFEWVSGSRFFFRPRARLAYAGRYTVEIPRSVRDTKGNGMERDFLSDFYVGSDFVPPLVLSSDPAFIAGGEQNVPVDRNITVDFSKSMNVQKTESAFSITPHVAGRFVWDSGPSGQANSRMVYTLTASMDYGASYRFRISSSAEDASGNALASEYAVLFITGDDSEPPSVTGINSNGLAPFWSADGINDGIDKNVSFYVVFSEPMNRPSAESAFSLSPSPGGHFSWNGDSILVFHPSRPLAPETLYQARVDRSAGDLNGLKIPASYQVTIRTGGAASLILKTGTVWGSNDGASYTPLFTGIPDPDAWPVAITMGLWPNQTYYFRVQFVSRLAPYTPVAMNRYSIYQNLSLASFGPDEGVVSDMEWTDDTTAVIRLSGLSNKLEPTSPVLYRLTVHGGSGGVKDIYGNTMSENFVFDFREP
ncbi:MAG TPA: Ig-like domain-containing protein [Spirochaetota bacterium]|nr:Ig-like domain-containing protein [Spirochaetota bacterium]